MTLTEFLLARIAEDEAVAQAADGEYYWIKDGERTVAYLDRFLPRVLAECSAKRGAISAAWDDHARIEGEWGFCRSIEQMSAKNDNPAVIQFLALPYADHPDYDEAWRA